MVFVGVMGNVFIEMAVYIKVPSFLYSYTFHTTSGNNVCIFEKLITNHKYGWLMNVDAFSW